MPTAGRHEGGRTDAVPSTQEDSVTTYDTIVIGAGMSGVTAARMLADAGADVIVLEARDRIGGRMHTDRTAGFPSISARRGCTA